MQKSVDCFTDTYVLLFECVLGTVLSGMSGLICIKAVWWVAHQTSWSPVDQRLEGKFMFWRKALSLVVSMQMGNVLRKPYTWLHMGRFPANLYFVTLVTLSPSSIGSRVVVSAISSPVTQHPTAVA